MNDDSGKRDGPTSRVRIKPRKRRSDVGYGRPPREHQFKPGQSGNPKGRKKGAKNEKTIFDERLNRKVLVREGGKVKHLPVIEVIISRVIESASRGDLKAIELLLKRYSQLLAGEIDRTEMGEDDRKIIEAHDRTIEAAIKQQSL